jgi:hypothetical protein
LIASMKGIVPLAVWTIGQKYPPSLTMSMPNPFWNLSSWSSAMVNELTKES